MKTQINKSPIQTTRGGGVKSALLIIFSIAFIFATSCDILTGSKDKEPEENQTTQQTPEDNTPVTPIGPGDDSQTPLQTPDDDPNNQQNNQSQDNPPPEPVELQIILGQTSLEEIENLANYSGVKISFAENTQTVDVFALLDLYEQLKSDAPENFLIQIDEYPENSSFLIDFAAKETAGKSNVDVLNSYYNKYNRSKLTEQHVGQTVETELIPGVKIVTLMDRWDDLDNKPWMFSNAFNVSRATKVKISQNYSLDGTYKSGIIGDNMTLKNLNSNTNISGEVRGMDSFSSVYDLFVKNQDVSKLPNMNVSFSCSFLDEGFNIYGYNIDTLIAKYYNNYKGSKLTLGSLADYVFDARAYLNGNMYLGNTYQNNAYPLDINAALVMKDAGVSDFMNLKISLEKGKSKITSKNNLGSLKNVYVDVDLDGIIVYNVTGVAEFNGEAPAQIYGSNSYIVFKKVSNHVEVEGNLGYVDITSLSATEADRISNSTYYYLRRYAAKNDVTLPGRPEETPGKVTNVNDLGVTKQQAEKNAVDGKPVDTVSKVLPRDIKASKMDLMRNILEDNQSTLLSFSGLTRESIA